MLAWAKKPATCCRSALRTLPTHCSLPRNLQPSSFLNMAFSEQDERFMRQALELARRGTALASPGARVGAVIADSSGDLVGSGSYTFEGVKHAEVLALEQAGSRARGGDIYLNLEPHCHQGRTPPCTDALIAAGIKRVVAAMAAPNPKVAGKGFQQLRAAGITVETGLFAADS